MFGLGTGMGIKSWTWTVSEPESEPGSRTRKSWNRNRNRKKLEPGISGARYHGFDQKGFLREQTNVKSFQIISNHFVILE